MKTIKGDKNMKSITGNECIICDGQGGNQTERCLHCNGTGVEFEEFQTWPWDTIVLMNIGTDKDLTIPGTDIEVIYDREAKVYRRK